MLSVILIWLYVGITTFITGYGVLRVITRHLSYNAHVCTGIIAADAACRRHLSEHIRNADAYFMCGLVCVTVYAQLFSLFAGVGLLANALLCALCALTVLVDGKAFAETVRRLAKGGEECVSREEECESGDAPRGGQSAVWRLCAVAVLFLIFAYGTSRGMIHYDTGLYHAQSIRWIEEYGVVKGLGNLHCRLAYNSSSFALSALYSMAFLGGQSYHCMAGWLAFLLAAVCLRMGASLRERRLRASDFARVMCVYYLVNIFDEMISPASDYFMVLIAFYIVIKWLELAESGEREIQPYALLCVLGVFLMTVKLSAALILLLTVYPAVYLVREKRWGETGVYLTLGFVTALPFFIRNVAISGWLVYPFTQIDLFEVVWKIPKGLADYDAREIQVWGRGYTDVAQFDLPVREWLPGWFRALAGSDKVFVLAAAAAVAVLLAEAVYLLWRQCGVYLAGRRKAAVERPVPSQVQGINVPDGSVVRDSVVPAALLTVQGTAAASFLFWLCTSPLIRYGCVWVYLTSAVAFGGLYETVMQAGERDCSAAASAGQGGGKAWGCRQASGVRESQGCRWLRRGMENGRGWRTAVGTVAVAAVALLLVYKGFALAREIAGSFVNDYWLVQKDYETYETYSYEIGGITFYCPAEGDQTGYDSFPSSPAEAEILFLGEGIADGFRAAE